MRTMTLKFEDKQWDELVTMARWLRWTDKIPLGVGATPKEAVKWAIEEAFERMCKEEDEHGARGKVAPWAK